MKPVPLLSLVGVLIIFIVISIFNLHMCSGVSVIRNKVSEQPHHLHNLVGNHSVNVFPIHFHHHRVKRQLVAYRRLEAGGILPVLGNRRRHGGGRKSAAGEDGSDINIFKSAGVGYEHHHNDRCEESKCGYNIRHCPHGCVFNSFQCGGGSAYDTCCC